MILRCRHWAFAKIETEYVSRTIAACLQKPLHTQSHARIEPSSKNDKDRSSGSVEMNDPEIA